MSIQKRTLTGLFLPASSPIPHRLRSTPYSDTIISMVSVTTLIEIVGILVILGGAIGAFYSMQTRQNMKIKELEGKVSQLTDELSVEREKRIKTGEAIVQIFEQLKHISEAIDELKSRTG